MSATFKEVDLGRGTLVISLRPLDPSGANVRAGMLGVIFEDAEYHEDGTGPMVRWFSGGACNVYDGQVAEFDKETFDWHLLGYTDEEIEGMRR